MNSEHCCCFSVTQVCPTLCDPMDCGMPGVPVLHHLPELAQTHEHRRFHFISNCPGLQNIRLCHWRSRKTKSSNKEYSLGMLSFRPVHCLILSHGSGTKRLQVNQGCRWLFLGLIPFLLRQSSGASSQYNSGPPADWSLDTRGPWITSKSHLGDLGELRAWGGRQLCHRSLGIGIHGYWCPPEFYPTSISSRTAVPNLLAPGTNFMEDNCSTGWGVRDGFGWFNCVTFIVCFISTVIASAPPQIIRH